MHVVSASVKSGCHYAQRRQVEPRHLGAPSLAPVDSTPKAPPATCRTNWIWTLLLCLGFGCLVSFELRPFFIAARWAAAMLLMKSLHFLCRSIRDRRFHVVRYFPGRRTTPISANVLSPIRLKHASHAQVIMPMLAAVCTATVVCGEARLGLCADSMLVSCCTVLCRAVLCMDDASRPVLA